MKKLRMVALLSVLGLFTMSCGDELTELVVDEVVIESDSGNPTDPRDDPE